MIMCVSTFKTDVIDQYSFSSHYVLLPVFVGGGGLMTVLALGIHLNFLLTKTTTTIGHLKFCHEEIYFCFIDIKGMSDQM